MKTKLFTLLFAVLCLTTNAWGQLQGTYEGVTYQVTMSTTPTAAVVGVTGNPTELTIPASIPYIIMSGNMVSMGSAFQVNTITSFTGATQLATLTLETTDAMTFNAALPNTVTKLRLPSSAQQMYQQAAAARYQTAQDLTWIMAMSVSTTIEWYTSGNVEVITSGNCGDDYLYDADGLQWNYEDGTLTISLKAAVGFGGNPEMADYTVDYNPSLQLVSDCPWYDFRTQITTVVLPEGLQTIGNNAFYGFTNLESIELPSTLTSIGQSAFHKCTSLTTITSNAETAPAIEDEATSTTFGNITHDITVNIPNNSTNSYNSVWGADHGNNGAFIYVESLDDPNSINATGDDNLSWTYENGVLTISGTGAMKDFENVSPNPDFFLTPNAPWYEHHNDIQQIVIGEGVTRIGDMAFVNCSTLVETNIVLPTTIQSIGSLAFGACLNMTGINLPSGLTSIENQAFSGCQALTSIEIPASLTSIGQQVFENCYALATVTLNEGLQTIGEKAFYGCNSLTSVTIPATVTSIATGAFVCEGDYAGTLKTIVLKGSTPPTLGEYVNTYFIIFSVYPISGAIDVYVPSGSLAAYSAENAWGTAKGDATTISQGKNYTLTYHEYGTQEEGGEKSSAFCDATSTQTHEELEELAAANNNQGTLIDHFTIVRPIQANGYLNTLCLPFDMTAQQLRADNSPLKAATIYEFAAQEENAGLVLVLNEVDHIEAGYPYFFSIEGSSILSQLDFYDVTVKTAEVIAKTIELGDYELRGTLEPTPLTTGTTYIFLGAENTLYYPSVAGNVNPFRAYFAAVGNQNQAPARISFGRNTATDVDQVQGDEVQITKIVRDGQLVILRNGVEYNAAGQVIK